MPNVLVPLDGSSFAERALPLAALVAQTGGGRLELVEAIDEPPVAGWNSPYLDVQAGASDYLVELGEELRAEYGLATGSATSFGAAAGVILSQAAAHDIGWIVMTTHARHGLPRAVLGSVAEHVLRESPVPVYLVPPAAQDRDFSAIRRLVIPLDGSELSEAVLKPAAAIARQLGAAITLTRVYEPPHGAVLDERRRTLVRSLDQEVDRMTLVAEQYMAPLVRRFRAVGLEANHLNGVGREPAAEILRLAQRAGADLVLMATHGRSGLDRLRHGSITEEVLRQSCLPLLTFGRGSLRELVRRDVAPAASSRVLAASAR